MDEEQRLNLVSLLNRGPLNLACLKHLKPAMKSPAFLHSLSLVRQALETNPDDELDAMLVRLDGWNPRAAQDWLFGEEAGGGLLLDADSLDKVKTPEAESLMLDLLRSQMAEHG